MGMSPRLLRPRQTGFTPRSISGLALWLDASSSDTLYTTDAGAVTAVSSPLDIAGCVGWWDASDAASITQSSGLVSQWNDKSGQGNHATASGGLRPTLTSNALNSRSVLTFGGSQGLTGNLTASISTNAYSVFVVCRISGAITNGRVFSTAGAGNDFGSGSVIPCVSTGGTLSAFAGTQGANVSGVTGFASYGVFAGVLSSNLVANSAGGLSAASAAATLSTAVTRFGFGVAAQGGTGFNTCDIAEIVLYPTALSTADRARVEAYLAAKWGISGVHTPATATNDPVGAWLDKSGNGRHAVQATAARRVVYTANSLNGKPALTALGEPQGNKSMSVAAFPFSDAHTAMFVFRASALNQTICLRGPNINDQPRATVSGSPLTFGAFKGGTNQAQVFSTTAYSASQWSIAGLINNVSFIRGYLNGVYGTAVTSNTESWSGNSALRLFSLSDTLHTLNGGIAEFIYYDKQLTAAELDRVAKYLAAKWGVSLAPQVSNADAQDWINRVYSNGGTVSTATAAAVNTFCESIDAAGIRDRFYRLNLFCGTGLNAALVPLYRGPSRTGSQFGNTTDTNNGPFVSGDYTESSGLLGNGSSKHLNTGVQTDGLPNPAVGHLSAYVTGQTVGRSGWLSAFGAGFVQQSQVEYNHSDGNTYRGWGREQTLLTTPGTVKHLLVTRGGSTDQRSFNDGSLADTNTVATTMLGSSAALTVLARNVGGSVGAYSNGRVSFYSIGDNVSTAQVSSFYAALLAFQQTLGRA